MTLVDLLMKLQMVRSRSEARRLINQGAVHVDEQQIPWDGEVAPGTHKLRVGKTRTMMVEFKDVKDA